VALVAVPIAAMVVTTCAMRTATAPADAQNQLRLAGADVRVWLRSTGQLTNGPNADQVLSALAEVDPAVRGVVLASANGPIVTRADARQSLTVTAGPVADPLVASRWDIAAGRLPSNPGEVALSPDLARDLESGVGSTVTIPELDLRGTVVGVASRVEAPRMPELLTTQMPALVPEQVGSELFVQTSGVDDALVAALRSALPTASAEVRTPDGPTFLTELGSARQAAQAAEQEMTVRWSIVGEAIAFVVLGLVISVAFALGARRQLRTLGLLAANGASPATVRATVLAQGLWCGLLGAGVGLVAGLATLAVVWPLRPPLTGFGHSWWVVEPLDLGMTMLVGVVAAVGSALLPARTAARLSVLQALSGRRPMPPVRGRIIGGGAVVAIAGFVLLGIATSGARMINPASKTLWTALALAALVAILAGAVAAAQVLVAVAGSIGARVGGAPRFALRSVARQRSRYGSVVAGIAAIAALAIGVATVTSTASARVSDFDSSVARPTVPSTVVTASSSDVRHASAPVTNEQAAAITRTIGPADRLDLRLVPIAMELDGGRTFMGSAQAVVATPEVREAYVLDDAQRAALDRTGIIVVGEDRPARVRLFDQGRRGEVVPSETFPHNPVPAADGRRQPEAASELAGVLITPEALAALGRDLPSPSLTAFFARAPITDGQKQALRGLQDGNRFLLERDVDATHGRDLRLSTSQTSGSTRPDYRLATELGISAITLVLTGFVIAIGLALASADSRDERDTLVALGAAPRLLRRIEGTKAATLAFLGALLAVPTGILPVVVAGADSRLYAPTIIPWTTVALLVVAVPFVVGIVTVSGSGVRMRLHPTAATRFSDD
jgi:putative ABC transport system permease protein